MHVHVGKGPRSPTLLGALPPGGEAVPEQPISGGAGLTACCEWYRFAKKILDVIFIMTCYTSWIVLAMQVFWSPQSAF